jgi:hypothetical protein
LSSNPPLSTYVIFLDRNFGQHLVATELRKSGLTVEVHAAHFPEANAGEESDEYWIRHVTSQGWVIFTRNGRIRNNPLERQTFIQCGARVFNIRNANADAAKVTECIARATSKIEQVLANEKGPFIVGISLNGDVTFIDNP